MSKDSVISSDGDDVAVVGLSCRFPSANSPEAYWDLLSAGQEAVGEVPADRAPHVGRRVGRAGLIDGVEDFDAGFFGVSPREAAAMDPRQRLVLELAWEALEHAGIEPSAVRGDRVGVFVGAMGDDYATLVHDQGEGVVDSFTLSALQRGILANRISFFLGLTGPSAVVDSAQSSALVAVHQAYESVRRGESAWALAGGVNLILSPESTATASEFGALSPDGRCYTFDARANGYVRGEGAGDGRPHAAGGRQSPRPRRAVCDPRRRREQRRRWRAADPAEPVGAGAGTAAGPVRRRTGSRRGGICGAARHRHTGRRPGGVGGAGRGLRRPGSASRGGVGEDQPGAFGGGGGGHAASSRQRWRSIVVRCPRV